MFKDTIKKGKIDRDRAVIITQTPMRVTLAGGGTDVDWYSNSRGGAWISASINRYLIVTLTKTEDSKFIGYSYGREAVQGNSYLEIPNPYVRACLEHAGVKNGISLSIASEVSGRSGLGGSGALEVGLLNALYCYKGESVSRLELGQKAFKIERYDLGRDYIGPQDQYIVALGGIQYFERSKNGNITVETLPLSLNTIAELESNLLYFRTGIFRDASLALADKKKQVDEKKDVDPKEKKRLELEKFKALDEIKKLGAEAKKYLLKGDIDSFGKTFDTHWKIKKTLSSYVSNKKIDRWYEAAKKAGALGGKIMGAGGGGWFVFYVNKNKSEFRKKMSKLGLEEERIRFDKEGSKVVLNF